MKEMLIPKALFVSQYLSKSSRFFKVRSEPEEKGADITESAMFAWHHPRNTLQKVCQPSDAFFAYLHVYQRSWSGRTAVTKN